MIVKSERNAFSLVEVMMGLLILGIIAQLMTENIYQLIRFKATERESHFQYQANRLILDLNQSKLNLKLIDAKMRIDHRPVYYFYSLKTDKEYRLIIWHQRLVLTGSNKEYMPLSKGIYIEKMVKTDKSNYYSMIIRELEHLKHLGRQDNCLSLQRCIYMNND
ncbi:prepilin-type N-terminal cleavage/methylation domain-containing protein [Weissella coleopterorum]|uniref:Prepilin-type N-terminal cleavage/methylation domain-containing protein n=1 Tax=Weissella coleopterorum TaxID=2714949 RepID=A0A6G8B071_9LACO|nr:prepilin-type N-terminal cleavage/methylation domain-containing protein [Weissella coleopterorum]QIL50637.1 prepilin-type N-terminal cleavage/methylation domain-containing protein [Weissella coleopterorum]